MITRPDIPCISALLHLRYKYATFYWLFELSAADCIINQNHRANGNNEKGSTLTSRLEIRLTL